MNYVRSVSRTVVAGAMFAICAACRAESADAAKQSVNADAAMPAGGSVVAANDPTAAIEHSAGVNGATTAARSGGALGAPVSIKVYKDANCGCCAKWADHLTANGFKVETMDMPDLSLIKQKYGVKDELQSCHTAIVNGYVVEGHVPADVIRKMLKDKPAIVGLAVPGMPMGSPGMEGPTRERYDVLTFDRAGRTSIYAKR